MRAYGEGYYLGYTYREYLVRKVWFGDPATCSARQMLGYIAWVWRGCPGLPF